MPALNNRLRSGASSNAASPANNGPSWTDHLTFANIMASVMTVLALKERWDNHQANQEERAYRRATRGTTSVAVADNQNANAQQPGKPLNAPPPYRDNPSADDISLEANVNTRLLDGEEDDEISPPRGMKRRIKQGCCVCCGIRCDIVFKALGIVILLYLGYGAYKLVRWATTPAMTGLEDMPEYSTSLGCENVPFYFGSNDEDTQIYNIPLSTGDSSFMLDIKGGAVGTLVIAQSDFVDVVVDMMVRTNDETLLSKVSVDAGSPSPDDLPERSPHFNLVTPSSSVRDDACMRFDIILKVPSHVSNLTVVSQSISHVKFAEHHFIDLDMLSIDLQVSSPENLLLPHAEVKAKTLSLEIRGGYLVGSLSLLDSANISTKRGTGVANVKVDVAEYPGSVGVPGKLTTQTGGGRADFTYSNHDGRMISSDHSSTGGDLYLTYKAASYNGPVDIKARSWSSTGLLGVAKPAAGRPGSETPPDSMPYHGDESGPDRMKVRNTAGWVGLYF